MTSVKNYEITIQDVDGITIAGTNYKINSGRKIALLADTCIVSLPMRVDVRPRSNRYFDSSSTYSELLGQHICAGIEPMKFSITGKMWADDGSHPRDTDYLPINFQLLNDLRIYNHKIYLKDYQGSDTDIVTPINTLIQKTDLLGNTLYTSDGIPVVVTKIDNIKRGIDSERGLFMSYSIELEEDR